MDEKRSIAEQYSLDYYRRARPTRAWKSPWNYVALLVTLLVLAGMYAVGRNSTFQAAPVASVHASFGADCASCHDQSWAVARRLTTLSDVHHSVSDLACQKCHAAARHAIISLAEPACVVCHQEHRPEKTLVEVADSACTSCHRDLPTLGLADVSFAPKIRQFETGAGGHPEFSLLRTDANAVGTRHEARVVARFIDAEMGGGAWRDRGGLKFNHRVHLDPAGVLNPAREQVQLVCSDCHVSYTDGGYMRPVEYEKHCTKCHPLSLAAPFSELGQLPHSSVDEVRGVIRERLARRTEQISVQQTQTEAENRLPRLPSPARLNSDQENQVANQMELADHAVFGVEAKGMCRKCHHFIERDDQWHVLVEDPTVVAEENIAGPFTQREMVPSRWMRHARFNHKNHRAVECVECHQAKTSTETADILMPPISLCQTCHGDGAQTDSMHAKADCVVCHTYHDETHTLKFEGVPLKQLFPKTSAASGRSEAP
jgi:predicted CXXCH cytochrome family protein